jgi:hypothetical protein
MLRNTQTSEGQGPLTSRHAHESEITTARLKFKSQLSGTPEPSRPTKAGRPPTKPAFLIASNIGVFFTNLPIVKGSMVVAFSGWNAQRFVQAAAQRRQRPLAVVC